MSTSTRPPVILTFLAPAARCNQRCPACVIDHGEEPVRRFELEPNDYARFVDEFAEAGVPILAVAFQGYEVTLPESWPYVEAVFAHASQQNVRCSFITNGMLLWKRVDRIRQLGPRRITVSLDGSDAAANDPIRGLPGAFETTTRSIQRFLLEAPELRDCLAIGSCLFDDNYESLLAMPQLLHALGITRWHVSWELKRTGERLGPADTTNRAFERLLTLRRAADTADIRFHVSDDFERFTGSRRDALNARHPYNPDFLYRLDPLGYVRTGRDLLDVWRPDPARQWRPGTRHALDVTGYDSFAKPFVSRT